VSAVVFDMDPENLLRDELEYELEVRGYSNLEMTTVVEMRRTLSIILRDEKIGTLVDMRTAVFDRDADLTACTRKTVELQNMATDFSGPVESPAAIKFFSKLSHLIGRLTLIRSEADDVREAVKKLRGELNNVEMLVLERCEQ
ncbi:hypothetical protein CBL_20134, partial [Carabus blaptoides fortunei]